MVIDKTKGNWAKHNTTYFQDVFYQIYYNNKIKLYPLEYILSQNSLINSDKYDVIDRTKHTILYNCREQAKLIIRTEKINKIKDIINEDR